MLKRVTNTAGRLKEILQDPDIDQTYILEACKPYAEEFGIKILKSSLSQYVSGKSVPKQDRLTVLSLALNVSETWLMGFDVPKERDSILMDAEFHASILKDFELLEMISKYKSLSPSGQQIIKNMIDELSIKKD